mgnify:CR=1 FL=1|tara:strand:- start:207 stop:398 length:192 start_codon:yes stop_codon:yes gene_type:complete
MNTPMNLTEAVSKALFLALTAPDEERSQKAAKLADDLASYLSAVEIEAAKADALERANMAGAA